MRVVKHFAPGLDAKSMALEVRERITEELDYEHEAHAQRLIARRWRGHPFIAIPDVVTDLCRERVLVTEWMEGTRFEGLKVAPKATRDRVGEIVFRFLLRVAVPVLALLGRSAPGELPAARRRADGVP